MAHVQQSHQIQERQQRQGGWLGALFNIASMLPFPEAQMAGKVGNAFLNPTGSNLSSLATSTAKMVGGENSGGDLSSKTDEPEVVHNAEEEAQEEQSGDPTEGKDLNVAATNVGGKTPEAVTDDSSAEKNKESSKEDPLSLYSNMTMDEVFKMHPELQGMFTQHLFQA